MTTSRLLAKDNKPVAAVAVVAVTDPVEAMASAVVTEAVAAMARAVAVVVVAEAAAEAVRRVAIAQEPLVLRARLLKVARISTPKFPRREELSAEKAEITAVLVASDLVTRSTDMSAKLVKNSIHSTASPEQEQERRIRRRAATERATGAKLRMM